MEKGKARRWTLGQSSSFDDEMVIRSGPIILNSEPDIEVREVIELTDDEKRRVGEIRDLVERCPEDVADEVQNETFLLSLLERAGVV